MNIETRNEILRHFVSEQAIDTGWVAGPFAIGDKAAATNKYALVAMENSDGLPDCSDKVRSVYPVEHNDSTVIEVKQIAEVLSGIDKTEETITTETPCDECKGAGEVTWSYPGKVRHYDKDSECPVCDGDGYTTRTKVKTGRMAYDPYARVGIKGTSFNANRMAEMLWLAEKVGVETVTLLRSGAHANLFSVGECELLLMRTMKEPEIVLLP